MDGSGLVEENGSGISDPLNAEVHQQLIPAQSSNQTQSVIQQNQQSVIQTATNIQPMTLSKGVLLVSKPNSVIHTTQGSIQAVHIKPEPNVSGNIMTDTNSDDSFSDDESPKRRRDLLERRPSYRKILNDLGGGEIVGTLQLASSGGQGEQALHTITTSGGSGGTIVQYTQGQDGQHIFVPAYSQPQTYLNWHKHPDRKASTNEFDCGLANVNIGGGVIAEDQSRKREMRLLKNREAARECRRKKKEYIKCLENRVAVLENQNKALIDELKSLKELYCQQKNE